MLNKNNRVNLKSLLNYNLLSMFPDDIYIKNIELDSRKVKSGDLFIAIRGHHLDGKNFINEAIDKGALAVFTESDSNNIYFSRRNNIPIFYIPNLIKKISNISSCFYNNPSKKLKIIAVTGTNGKTTVTNLLYQWSNFLGEKGAIIGTNGNGFEKNFLITKNTTDSAVNIQKFLNYFLIKKVTFVALEVSSHAILQYRVKSLSFASSVFINLTHDHLDYHGNMKNYELSKWILFSKYKSNNIIINADDKIGYRWLYKLQNAVAVSINKNFVDIKNHKFWLKVNNIIFLKKSIIVEFNSTWGKAKININLLGKFNITNFLLSLTTLLSMDYPLKLLIETSNYLKPVCGRMELFKVPEKPSIIVDYAHNPDSLKKALQSARLYCKNNLWCIFGCGGNRDISKRSLMGYIAKKYADFIILTDDNPRYENSQKIINDIISKIKYKNDLFIITKRDEAIFYAINNAKKNDLILIAGKGHENYQIIGNQYSYFSDRELVSKFLRIKK